MSTLGLSWRLVAVALCVAPGTAVFAQNYVLPPAGPTPVIQAVPVGPQDVVFGPGNDEHLFRKPNHPPIDLIPPMPMPAPAPTAAVAKRSSMTVFDASSGEWWEIPLGQASELPGELQPGYKGVDQRDSSPETFGQAFGSMSAACCLNGFPQSGNVRLIMRFTDQGGTARYFVCSGAMQDAGVVLTAAHCVYARNPNGINIFNWANEIWIYPAWDGNGGSTPTSTEVIQNFGWTYSTSYLAGTNYINNGDFNSDVGAIAVNRGQRSVGMLTGWYGFAWGYDCGTIQSRLYYNFSYPAETCSATLHTGRTMYLWSGTFDSCPGNQLQIDTSGGCFNAGWGGMSGSNAYWYDGGNRYAHAICSNSNRSTTARYCKVWDTAFNDINVFRNNVRGGTFDLEALRFRLTGSTTIQATTNTSGSQVLASNTTNADPGNANFTVRVYLSTNNIISSGDTLVGTFGYTWDYAPMQNLNLNLGAVTIPNVSPGTYWLGCILDPGTDSFSGDNATSTWDAQQITVTAAPPPAPPNNSCGAPIYHAVGSTSFGSNVYATADGGDSCRGNTNLDVWYYMYPPYTGRLRIDTCGSYFDTVLSLHTGCPGTSGNQVACNDDDGGVHCPSGLDSYMEADVVANVLYYIRVAGYGGGSGSFALNTSYVVPSNDNCTGATLISTGTTVTGSLAGASNDGQSSCGSSASAADAWWTFIAPQTGYLRIDTCGSQFDTVLSLHTACPGTPGNEIACNDDHGSGPGGCSGAYDSALVVGVVANGSYLVRVSGYAGSIGGYTLRSYYVAPPNDNCSSALTLVPGTNTVGATNGSTTDGDPSCRSGNSQWDVWYRLYATCSGRLRIDTCGSLFDTVLSVHSACPGTAANSIVCNDDDGQQHCPNFLDSYVELNIVAGTTYFVRVGGYAGNYGGFYLNSQFINTGADDCTSALPVGDGSYVFSNCAANTDGPEENFCAFCCGDNQVNGDLWYRYTAPVSGVAVVDTCASVTPTFDTKIAVYGNSCPFGTPDSAIACNDDDGGVNCPGVSGVLSYATFACVAGQEYLIRVGGYGGSRGTGTLTIQSSGTGCTVTCDYNDDGGGDNTDVGELADAIASDTDPYPNHCKDFNQDGGADNTDISDMANAIAGGTCP